MQYSLAWAATHPEDAEERLGRTYQNLELGTDDPDGFAVSVAESGDKTVALARTDWTGSAHARTDGNSFFSIGDVYEGRVALTVAGEELDSAGVVLLPPVDIRARWEASHRSREVRIERTAIDAFARDHLGAAGAEVAFSSLRPLSPAHERLWRSVERHVREDIAAHGDLLHNDLVWEAATRHLIGTLLTAFPNSTLGLEQPTDGARALPATIRRAIAYMEEHLSEPFSLADVADAARLSPRGLQDAFQRLLGRTPTQQLRLLRLEAARADLVAADPSDGDTVREIAHRWGFVHVARFSAAYRDRYGENPRETLQR
ncbi:helix-turn-helix transcriptional regulator [Leifsonia virtsii]|uniref:AraC family transcriptional regulator n=1 Tax=Leifsonia virtsii TaxID=3035915 RepID=A0ABT8IWC6_9MICO|nr:AraC family transcriptional regulator [Leifsonia virtsii]MDN4597124.1 AraC family transcriptional regulator [Leifsonia virtsii]